MSFTARAWGFALFAYQEVLHFGLMLAICLMVPIFCTHPPLLARKESLLWLRALHLPASTSAHSVSTWHNPDTRALLFSPVFGLHPLCISIMLYIPHLFYNIKISPQEPYMFLGIEPG